ncbi:MAG: hypothetical protein AAGE52_13075 [Myxococcota bacterium]
MNGPEWMAFVAEGPLTTRALLEETLFSERAQLISLTDPESVQGVYDDALEDDEIPF